MKISKMERADWQQVAAIYGQSIEKGDATFETELPTFERWDAVHCPCCRLVARQAGRIVGWAALTPVSPRRVFSGVAELSIYVDEAHHRRGIGRALMERLVTCSEENGYWTLVSNIFTENAASLRLHEMGGFRIVGRREKLGRDKHGAWRDMVMMERRSGTIG